MSDIICSGMERSGSTVAWQIAQLLLDQPCRKTHLYVPDISAIYTYRHPAEAYISFRDRLSRIYPASIAASYARERIEQQREVHRALSEDAKKNNRSILFIKYEDYYDKPLLRIEDIAKWLDKSPSRKRLDEIHSKTSIEANMTTGDFSDFDESTGLHGTHINKHTRGLPGALLQNATADKFLSSSSLKLLCKHFGYVY